MAVSISIISGTVGEGNTVRLKATGIISRGGIPFVDSIFGDVVLSNYDKDNAEVDCLINSLDVTPRIRWSSCPWEKPISGNWSPGDGYQGMTLQSDGRWKANDIVNQMDLFGAGRIHNDGDFGQIRGNSSGGINLKTFDSSNALFDTHAPGVGESLRIYCYNTAQAAFHFRDGDGWPTDNDGGGPPISSGSPIAVSGGRPYYFQVLDSVANRAVDFDFDRIEFGSGGWSVFPSPVYGITGYEEGFIDLTPGDGWTRVKVGSGSVDGWEDERDVTGGSSASLGSVTSNDHTSFFPNTLFATGRKRSGDIAFNGIPVGTPFAWVHIKMGLMTNTGSPNLNCLAYAGSEQVFDANFAYITGVVKIVDIYVKRDGSGVCPIPKTTGTDAVLSAIAFKDEARSAQTIDAEIIVITDSIYKPWQGSTDDLAPHPGVAERIAVAIDANIFIYGSCADFDPSKRINVYQIGREGYTLQDMDTEIANHLGGLYKSTVLQLVVITGGANNHTESDSTIYNRMKTNKTNILAQGANYKPVIVSPIPYGANFDGSDPFMMAGVAALINANAISDGFFRKADVNSDPIWTSTPKSFVWRNTEYVDQVNNIGVHIKQTGVSKATEIILNSIADALPIDLPTLSTATVENANKNKILLTYDRALSVSSVPATGDFTVPSKTVTGVTVVGSVVTVTVNTNFAFGDNPTVSYSPGVNPIKDNTLGNNALALIGQIVTNNIANPDTTAPALSSAQVANANPNKIVLTYNETLDATSVPANGDFTPSGGKSVTGVSIVGTVVTLTLNSNYGYGDVITVSYTPGVNKIRDAAHNNSIGLLSQSVTNNISNPDVTAPSLSSAVVQNSAKNKIRLTYNEALDESSTPATSDFTVSGGKSVTGVSIVGTLVELTLNSEYVYGDTITVSYTSGVNKIRDAAHNNAANLSSQSVTNNIAAPDTTPPLFQSAAVQNATKDRITLEYNETLDSGSVPDNGDFTVSGGKTVIAVAIIGSSVRLTVSSDYTHGAVITVSYTPGTNKIRDVAHNNSVGLIGQSVVNNIGSGSGLLSDLFPHLTNPFHITCSPMDPDLFEFDDDTLVATVDPTAVALADGQLMFLRINTKTHPTHPNEFQLLVQNISGEYVKAKLSTHKGDIRLAQWQGGRVSGLRGTINKKV